MNGSERESDHPKMTLRDRAVIMKDLAASVGGFDGEGHDAVASRLASLTTLMRLNLEVLIDLRDLVARTRAGEDGELEVEWERRSGYRKGDGYRGLT